MDIKSLIIVLCLAFITSGCPLRVTSVKAPDVNCVFNTSCKLTVNDTISTIPIPAGGTNFLQSRTFKAGPGAPAAGLYGYEYRIDLRNAVGITHMPCITTMTVKFDPIASNLDYDGDGNVDQVYVITKGGLGSIGLASAEKKGNKVIFTFASPICPGSSPGSGQSSYFFGLASPSPPEYVGASVTDTTGMTYNVQVRSALGMAHQP